MSVYGKMSKFVKSVLIRKGIYAGISIVLMIIGIGLCFYFQLNLQAGLGNIIAFICLGGIIIVTLLARKSLKRDNYNYTLLAAYGAFNDLKDFHSVKAAVSKIESYTEKKVGGFDGWKTSMNENKELLSYMLLNTEAFDKYVGSGPIKALGRKFQKHDLMGFCDFAIIDLIVAGTMPNNGYRLVSSTRWYPIYQRYIKGAFKWFLLTILPYVVWFFGTNIATSSMKTSLAISEPALILLRWGILAIILQLVHLFGNSKLVAKIATDMTTKTENGAPIVPSADIDYLKGFADTSTAYKDLAVKYGFMSNVAEQVEEPVEQVEESEETEEYNFED